MNEAANDSVFATDGPAFSPKESSASGKGPYEQTLVGEYSRLLLLIASVPLLIWFLYVTSSGQPAVLSIVACSVLLASLVSSRGLPALRIGLLVAMAVNVLAMFGDPDEIIVTQAEDKWDLPNWVLFSCLASAIAFESIAWVGSSSKETIRKVLGWGVLLIPVLIYVAAIPAVVSVLESFQSTGDELEATDPNWKWWNEAGYRMVQFGVFATFAYVGACVGSFLNVAAYCIPRGEKLGLRDSMCPQCDTKISRIDNLPVFSYINLGACCRSCGKAIPPRYLGVELVVATIFGSLFLYQLIVGCPNVPHAEIMHSGVLWVILYPKWHAIGLYLYHAGWMCAILILALFERDKQQLKIPFSVLLVGAFFGAAAACLPLQTIPLTDGLSMVSNFSPVVEQLIKLAIGGVAGAAVGYSIALVFAAGSSAGSKSILTLAFLLTGIVLGWQALLHVIVLFALFAAVVKFTPGLNRLWRYPTTVLLITVMLHQPFWKAIASLWSYS
ncbi:MAG: prepilin peptidase [Planctomycetota bacterium]